MGDTLKDTTKQVLRAIDSARQDVVSIEVTRLDDFDIGDFSNEQDAKKLLPCARKSRTRWPRKSMPPSQSGDLMEELGEIKRSR